MVSMLAVSAIDCSMDGISGIMVSMLAVSVNHGFDQTKDHDIGICHFSAKYVALRSKSKDWSAQNQLWPSRATCLPMDCCSSELAL